MDFFHNIAISIWSFFSWYLAGLGVSLVLLQRSRRYQIFLLALLVGMCLLTLIGLFQISVLLIPLTPRFNSGVLILISLLICLWLRRANFLLAWKRFRQSLALLYIVPIMMVLVFAWLFHNGGFQLLVGSSDQLQYCENARYSF